MKVEKQIKNKLLKQSTHPKGTSVNSIPKGWEVLPFGSVFEFVPTYAVSRENLTYVKTKNKIQNIHYGDIHAKFNNEILDLSIDEELPFIKDEAINGNTFSFVKDGDLIIADVSEDYEGLGESVELKNVGKKKIVGGLHTFVVRSKNGKTAAGFRCYIFRNHIVKLNLKKIATGSNVYGVSKTNLLALKIILPSVAEQKKIAKILSNCDNAIELTEKLIAVKEKKKKELMQQLLTGKKRFKGFKGKVKHVSFSEVAELKHGYQFRDYDFVSNGIPVIKIANLSNEGELILNHLTYIDAKRKNEFQNVILNDDDILMALSGATIGKVCIAKTNGSIYLQNYRVGNFINDSKKISKKYLLFILQSRFVQNRVFELMNTGAQPNVGKGDFDKIFFPLPTMDEQEKIASVLSASDIEIQLLKNKYKSLKQQKNGLMQILLTGKKRVKTNDNK